MTRARPLPRARPVVPSPSLRVTEGPMLGTILCLDGPGGTVGRRADNTWVLADPTVSRVHARIIRESTAVVITDLGSAGGTWVNEAQVTGSAVLSHRDRVRLGSLVLCFEHPGQLRETDATTDVIVVPDPNPGPGLSPRQLQVLVRIAEGLTNREIGEQLGVTERTIKAYAGEIYAKLGVSNRAGAVAAAVTHRLLEDLVSPSDVPG